MRPEVASTRVQNAAPLLSLTLGNLHKIKLGTRTRILLHRVAGLPCYRRCLLSGAEPTLAAPGLEAGLQSRRWHRA